MTTTPKDDRTGHAFVAPAPIESEKGRACVDRLPGVEPPIGCAMPADHVLRGKPHSGGGYSWPVGPFEPTPPSVSGAEERTACADAANHHLYTKCGMCGATGRLAMDAAGLRRETIAPPSPVSESVDDGEIRQRGMDEIMEAEDRRYYESMICDYCGHERSRHTKTDGLCDEYYLHAYFAAASPVAIPALDVEKLENDIAYFAATAAAILAEIRSHLSAKPEEGA